MIYLVINISLSMSNYLSDLLSSTLRAVFGDALNTPLSLFKLQSNDDLNSTSDALQTPASTMKAHTVYMQKLLCLISFLS